MAADHGVDEPTVSVVIPVLNEEAHIVETMRSVWAQSYRSVLEVLVVDGGSSDRTRELAIDGGATVLDNPLRLQAGGMNRGLEAARGHIVVRVDGHCTLDQDYIERCVRTLRRTGAAMVGGAMRPQAEGPMQIAIAEAMRSRLGAGPARFHTGGRAGWVDTVYLGAYATETARAVGGYSTEVGVNEDAEFAFRMSAHGGIWFDPSIRSSYTPRGSLQALARQFWRYGLSRAATVRRHPRSLSGRQLAAPGLVVGLFTPFRRWIGLVYLGVVGAFCATTMTRRGWKAGAAALLSLPTMHLSWGSGFLMGIVQLVPPPGPPGTETRSHGRDS